MKGKTHMFTRPHKLRRVLTISAVSALAAVSLAACADAGSTESAVGSDCTTEYEFETVTDGTLTVATYDFPPYTTIEGGNVTGIEGELLNEAASRLCLDLAVESAGGASAVIPSVETGRADVGAGDWYRTNDRLEVVNMSYPIGIDASAIISMEGISVDNFEDDYIIASVAGNLWNDSLQTLLGDSFKIYQDEESIYSDLSAGRIDGIVASVATAVVRFESNPIEGVKMEYLTPHPEVPEFEQPGQFGWPSSQDSEALGEALDAVIQEMHDDGTIASVYENAGIDPELSNIEEVTTL